MLGEVRVVLDRGDPPDDLAGVVAGQKQLHLGVLVKRVVLVQHVRHIAAQRRNP